ncbi:hypothetical protein ABVK25_001615 [Lepraria finkii]|uniref:Uncharacterized protein n=1 Tax=Lepraria finkii TaxID=1340010 RepID=A0ABR4BJJ9_9LECA
MKAVQSILETQSAVLSNYEVLAHLTESRAKPRTTPSIHTNVSTVNKEINSYLTPPPTPALPSPVTSNPTTAIKPYGPS